MAGNKSMTIVGALSAITVCVLGAAIGMAGGRYIFNAIIATETASDTPAADTPIPALTTPVEYVLALTDVDIHKGPGGSYEVTGRVAGGQTAQVTGVSEDYGWWRVVCPDSSSGSCWVNAGADFTLPTHAPGVTPTATSTRQPCLDNADLVADVTVPDGSLVPPNTRFDKTWRIKNSGTCTWNPGYKLVHVGGSFMGTASTEFPLSGATAPNQTVDLTVNMISPAGEGSYQSNWKLQNPEGAQFGVGRSSGPFWVRIVTAGGSKTTITGVIFQDSNQNGVYDPGEPTLGERRVWLSPGATCNLPDEAVATAVSGAGGRYTLDGNFNGGYCVGLAGEDGLEDVASVTVVPGQALGGVNLMSAASSGSISGWLWADYCLTTATGVPLEGSCTPDANGAYHADGMIQPTEGYIAGVVIFLQAGPCVSDNPVILTAVTDITGKYTFSDLGPGTYCVSADAAFADNAAVLIPGEWTYPARGVWHQEITLQPGEGATPVNFGWEYQR